MKKVGIITFHNSYNCGSMLETYAIQESVKKLGYKPEIVDYSSDGQLSMYSVFFKNNNLKNIVKNLLILPHCLKIKKNNKKYISFKDKYFSLTKKEYRDNDIISDKDYLAVIAGSDQIWNITIPDYSDNYFLNWVSGDKKKIAYAPSFGSKNPVKYSSNSTYYGNMIKKFDYLSTRENNGKKWIKDLTGRDASVVLDPTLLLETEDYNKIVADDLKVKGKYIFFYCPSFNSEICKFVKKLSKKYKLPVIAWSSKNYYIFSVWKYGFKLAEYENPKSYLYYIKNAELVLTTSFHGTIFSTLFKKKFFTIKNGDMYGDDDRVLTLVRELGIEDRLIPFDFNDDFDYLKDVNYKNYDKNLVKLRKESYDYLSDSLKD